MKQLNLFLLLIFLATGSLWSQVRYYDQVFDGYEFYADVKYGNNISVLTGAPQPYDLFMDVYTPPASDTVTNRPVIVYAHTGTFGPQYFNQQITGGKRDSTIVEIAKRLTSMGYVVISMDYRLGWQSDAEDQDIRTSTLLKAAYRGVIDAKTCARYLRHSVAELENPYGIDPNKIGIWGQGTGGYIACGAYLDDISEVQIEKFIDSRTANFYVIEELDGNVDGTNETPLNTPNYVGYSSDFQFVVNMGGAMGDIVWVDGDPEKEPPYIGFHPITDPFAPYVTGAVINPITDEFVINVTGSRIVVRELNASGVNADFELAADNSNDMLSQMSKDMNDKIDAWSQIQFDDTTTLAEDNIYPFLFSSPQSGPWEWWGLPQLQAEIAFVNANFGTNFNANLLDFAGKLTNPDMSKEKALRYIDTLMAYVTPRAFYAFANAGPSSTEELLDNSRVQLEAFPNPAADYVVFKSNQEFPIEDIAIYNLEGRLMKVVMGVNNHQYEFQRKDLPPGLYVAKLKFEDGVLSKKIIFRE